MLKNSPLNYIVLGNEHKYILCYLESIIKKFSYWYFQELLVLGNLHFYVIDLLSSFVLKRTNVIHELQFGTTLVLMDFAHIIFHDDHNVSGNFRKIKNFSSSNLKLQMIDIFRRLSNFYFISLHKYQMRKP